MGILLIEDEPRIRAFIARGLGAEGFTVDETDDGRVGLRRALDEQYDLVILDLGLPSLDGLTPRSLFLIAFSMAAIEDLSKGETMTIRGSGMWNDASWFTGVWVP